MNMIAEKPKVKKEVLGTIQGNVVTTIVSIEEYPQCADCCHKQILDNKAISITEELSAEDLRFSQIFCPECALKYLQERQAELQVCIKKVKSFNVPIGS